MKDPAKSRAKNAAVVETVTTSIAKLQELLVQIEDLKQEGFPYRDAMRARVELHVRECVKLVFGDRSPEAHQWKHYRVRATSPTEVADTISQLQSLAAQLDRKKLELLGIAPTPPLPKQESAPSPDATSLGSVPPTPHTRITQVAEVAPTTVSSDGSSTDTAAPVSLTPPPTTVAAPTENPSPAPTDPTMALAPASSQASAPQFSPSPASPSTVMRPATPIAPESREQVRDAAIQAEAQAAAPRPLVSSRPEHRNPLSGSATMPPLSAPSVSTPPGGLLEPENPLDIIRRVCTRFHTIARQLRLRREYRPTLDVDDDRDVQDLLCALLRYELEEVAPHEWTPSYQNNGPAIALILPRHHCAVLGKKTKSGIGPREIGHQLTADTQEFSPAGGYQSVVCFVYDPEGRIGNPRGLEAELARVSDSQVVEVIIYPK